MDSEWAALSDQAGYSMLELTQAERFGEEPISAAGECAPMQVRAGLRRQEDDRHILQVRVSADVAQHFEALGLGLLQVDDHRVGRSTGRQASVGLIGRASLE